VQLKYRVKSTDIENHIILKTLDKRRLTSYHDSLKDKKKRLKLEDKELADVDENTTEKIV